MNVMNALPAGVGAAMLVLACAGRAGQDPPSSATGGVTASGGASASGGNVAASGGASTDGVSASGGGSDASCPSEPWAGPIPALNCSSSMEACSSDNAVPGSCSFDALSVTMAKLSKSCDVYCGTMRLGLHAGCIVDLDAVRLNAIAPQTESSAGNCMRSRLLGTRWDCATREGWATVYLGSCTAA